MCSWHKRFLQRNFIKAFESCFTNKKSFNFWKETVMERKRFFTLTFTMPRNVSELKILHFAKNERVLHIIFYSFDGETEEMTECNDV